MRTPRSGSPAKIPDFRRTCRLKFEPRRHRRRPAPCDSTLRVPKCWGRQRSQRGHENRALQVTEVGCCASGVPGLAAAGRASDKHEPVAHRRPLSRRAVREGSREGPRPLSRCQRTQCWTCHAGRGMRMGRGCNMPPRRQVCRHHPASRLARVGPASVRVQQQPDRSSQSAAGRYLRRYQRSAAA